MVKYFKVVLICFLIVGSNSSAQAQAFYRDSTLKDSLVNTLFQYGKETFYRGLEPQKASFIFQRILVLDCGHPGAQSFLKNIHQKYPQVSIKIQGCAEAGTEDIPSSEETPPVTQLPTNDAPSDPIAQNSDQLRQSYQELPKELSQLEDKAKEKDVPISDDQHQRGISQGDEAASYEAIAKDQKDLIRIQQGNIEYLKNELAEIKNDRAAGAVLDDDKKYSAMHREIADSHLTTEEKQMDLNVKDSETKTLRAQLDDLEQQLQLVQEIVNQKNAVIQSLQEELKAVKPVDR